MNLNRPDLPDIVIEFYKQIFEKTNNFKPSKFHLENSEVSWIRFEKEISKKTGIYSIGEKYLWDYCTFFFFRKSNNINKKFLLKQLISPTAVTHWFTKNSDWRYYLENWKNLNKIKIENVTENVGENVQIVEEMYRRRFFNSERGFVNCLENTSLADPNSKYCFKCVHINECKNILSINNKKLYNKRWS